jgi:hypothetical protein
MEKTKQSTGVCVTKCVSGTQTFPDMTRAGCMEKAKPSGYPSSWTSCEDGVSCPI